MRRRSATHRSGFTLLEVILAMSVGLLLLAALYLALNIQVYQASRGREIVDEASQVQLVFSRIANDLRGQVGPSDPRVQSTQGGTSATTGSTATTSGSTGTTTAADSTAADSASSSTPTTGMTSTTSAGSFDSGIQGDSQKLVITIGRVPRELKLDRPATDDSAPTAISDLRQVTYWLVGGGEQSQGLARLEVTNVTSADNPAPPGIPQESNYVIADNVQELTFQYHNGQAGTDWLDSWDATAMQADGKTPQGPPAAIAITLKMQRPSSATGQVAPATTYRYVVAIPTANNFSTNSNTP